MSTNGSHSAPSGGKQHVLVNVILDKSGSMSTKVQDVIGGFNLYLDELAKEQAVDYGFSLTLFDTVVEMKYKGVPLASAAKLDSSSYRPSGNTALFDAVGNSVQTVSTDGFDKIITVIMTDGEENSSREWTLHAIRELIKNKEAAKQLDLRLSGREPGCLRARRQPRRADGERCPLRSCELPGCLRLSGQEHESVLSRRETGPRVTSSKEKPRA